MSEFYARIESVSNSENSPWLLVAAPESNHSWHTTVQAQAETLGMHVKRAIETPTYGDFSNVSGIGISTTANQSALSQAFSLARSAQKYRLERQSAVPITIVNCCSEVPASVRADFLRYGCYVLSRATPEQIIDLFETALIDLKRRSRRGITLKFGTGMCPFLAYAGREKEVPAKGRLLFLLLALCRERREFSSAELSVILHCKTPEVKVYVDRLRRLILRTGWILGTSIGKQEVIQNTGKKGGYRLHARIDGFLRTEWF